MNVNEYKSKSIYSDGSGVSAYLDNRINMVLNSYGFYEEDIDPSVEIIEDNIIAASSHLQEDLNEDVISSKYFSEIPNIKYDKRLGYYQSLYVGHVVEDKYRKNSSSGGMATWVLTELMEKGLIDGVIHVRETKDSNILFKYKISRSVTEIKSGAKSKYYPVEMSEVLKEVRNTPGRYAVVGIPSFIMAIRLLAEVDPIIQDRIKYTIGLICGHQKSSKFAEAMAWQNGIKPGDLRYIDFRRKLPGRGSNQYGVEMRGLVDGEEVSIVKPTTELIGQNWGMGVFKSVFSDYTDDVMNETADITLGDAWLPEYTNQSEGNNIIIVRNSEINELINNAKMEKRLSLDSVDDETMFRSQSSHFKHTHEELAYRLYLKDIKNNWRPVKRVDASKSFQLTRRRIQDSRLKVSYKTNEVYQEALRKGDFSIFENEMLELTKEYRKVYSLLKVKELGLIKSVKKVLKIK